MKHTVNPLLFALLFSSIANSMDFEKLKKQIENAQADSKPGLLKDAYSAAMEKKVSTRKGTQERTAINEQLRFLNKEIEKMPCDQYALIAATMDAYKGMEVSGDESIGSYDPFNIKRQQEKKVKSLQDSKQTELKLLEDQSTELDKQIVALQKEQTELNKLYKSKNAEADFLGRAIVTLHALQLKDREQLLELKNQKIKRLSKIEEETKIQSEALKKADKIADLTQRTQDVRKINEQIEALTQEKTTLNNDLATHTADLLKMNQRLHPEKYPTFTTKVTTAISSTPSAVTSAVWGTMSVLKNAVGLGASVEQPSDEKPDNKA
ncbi:MAG TPA: hypothetical protein VHO47_01375 [Candidatus Babeliales bacterium]|nr:hypothetical protein [Candidatus Babeliales bacterium]